MMSLLGLGERLEEYGYHVSLHTTFFDVLKALLNLKWRLRKKSLEDLKALPEMTDPEMIFLGKFMGRLGGPAMNLGRNICRMRASFCLICYGIQ